MYCSKLVTRHSFEDFLLPIGVKFSGDNRWVQLAELDQWKEEEHCDICLAHLGVR
jgi:hypothetical protein